MSVEVAAFFAVFVRTAAVFSFSPLFSVKGIPAPAKVACALLITSFLFPSIRGLRVPTEGFSFVITLLGEIFIGFLIGSALQLLFTAAEIAGQWISLQMGFGFGGLYDPQSDTNIDALPLAYRWIVLMLFLGMDGHHHVLQALSKSLDWLPAGLSWNWSKGFSGWLTMMGSLFSISLQMAAPVLVALWVTAIILALLARLVPQFNVFLIDFPIKIAVGFCGLAFGLPLLGWSFSTLLKQSGPALRLLLGGLRG